MPKFKKGDPQALFERRDGGLFKKTFHSVAAAKRALAGYRAAGGRAKKAGRFSGKR